MLLQHHVVQKFHVAPAAGCERHGGRARGQRGGGDARDGETYKTERARPRGRSCSDSRDTQIFSLKQMGFISMGVMISIGISPL